MFVSIPGGGNVVNNTEDIRDSIAVSIPQRG